MKLIQRLNRRGGVSNAVVDGTGLIYTTTGLKVGSTATLYGNGTSIATATVDSAGKATWNLGAKPAAGTVITYDGVYTGSGGTVASTSTPPTGSTYVRLAAARTALPATAVPNASPSTNNQFQQLVAVTITSSGRYFRLAFRNMRAGNVQVLPGYSQLTLKVGIRKYVSGSSGTAADAVPTYTTEGGANRSLVLAPGALGYLYYDAGEVLATGQEIFLMIDGTYASAPADWPCSPTLLANSFETCRFGTGLADMSTATKTAWQSVAKDSSISSQAVLPPVAIHERDGVAGVGALLVGNSIGSMGSNDGSTITAVGAGFRGWKQKGYGKKYAVGNCGRNGLSMVRDLMLGTTDSDQQWEYHVGQMIDLGYNRIHVTTFSADFGVARTDAQIRTVCTNFVAKCLARNPNVRVMFSTSEPRTDSTNTTVDSADANYGASTGGAVLNTERLSFNAYIRTNPAFGQTQGYGFTDQGGSFQDTSDPTKWLKTGRNGEGTLTSAQNTKDGRHPETLLQGYAYTDNVAACDAFMTAT